ncbi:MAG TPA: NAD(P)H-dependent glycerol-3-phosphate dehydrogenase [Burkholderiales bacterium]|nr:NAD(P)H-dependent glycerol-3-phosphate dehydrogenase [Burkholderiales bacterium]
MNVGILGAGAWGTALAGALARRMPVTLWAREEGLPAAMRRDRENKQFLPGIPLPEAVEPTEDFELAARAQLVIAATSVAGLRPTLKRLKALRSDVPVIWLCKGFEQGTARLPHQVAQETLGEHATCGALSGPSFSAEVARGLPVALTLASPSLEFAASAAATLHGGNIRVYSSNDLVGVEVGGAVKNVMAIAAGISDGLGLGHNARAALITRGLAEMARLGTALGGRTETFMGLTGMGDLILTATGDLSRNRTVGKKIADGGKLDDVLGHLGHVAEGVPTARETLALAKTLGVEMPITEAVCAVLFDGVDAREAVSALLSRDQRAE